MSLCRLESSVSAHCLLRSRDGSRRHTLAKGSDRLATEPKWRFDDDQDRALLLRLGCCGSLRTEAAGEPAFVGACHCTECQRRTGSPLGVSTYFPKEQVRTEGRSKLYVRGGDSGRKIEFHFWPDCGSTVFWYAEGLPDLIGIAFGAFADPSMPAPTLSVWETTRHPWVTFDHQLDRFTVQPKVSDRDLERLSIFSASNTR